MYEIADKARSWAEIDLSALKHNFEYASKRIGRKVICVLKADAYGHGAVECGLVYLVYLAAARVCVDGDTVELQRAAVVGCRQVVHVRPYGLAVVARGLAVAGVQHVYLVYGAVVVP